MFLRGDVITWDVVGGVSTDIPKGVIGQPKAVSTADSESAGSSIGQVAGQAATTVALFALKYFVIVDIMINFMGNVNIELSPRLSEYVRNIKKAELPSIGFVEITSPISDGGGKMKENYAQQKEREKEEYLNEVEKLKEQNSSSTPLSATNAA